MENKKWIAFQCQNKSGFQAIQFRYVSADYELGSEIELSPGSYYTQEAIEGCENEGRTLGALTTKDISFPCALSNF